MEAAPVEWGSKLDPKGDPKGNPKGGQKGNPKGDSRKDPKGFWPKSVFLDPIKNHVSRGLAVLTLLFFTFL